MEAVDVGDLAGKAADGQVHLGQPPRGVVKFLAVDRNVALGLAAVVVAARVGPDELDGLDEHALGAAARVVDPPLVGLDHLHQEPNDAAGRVELTALLALGAGELGEEVIVDAAENVLGAAFLVIHPDVGDEVDELAEPGLVERGSGVVLGEHAF